VTVKLEKMAQKEKLLKEREERLKLRHEKVK
jgi:hypothetical protein